MNRSKKRGVAVATLTAVVASMAGASGSWAATTVRTTAITTAPGATKASAPDAREIRSMYTSEFGVDRPVGVAWDPDRQTLVVTGARRAGGTKLVRITPGEELRGRAVLRSRAKSAAAARVAGVARPAGTAYSADGTLHVLDALTNTIVNESADGRVERIRLRGLNGAALRGLAYEPVKDRLYVADASADKLYAVDDSGRVYSPRTWPAQALPTCRR